ncbi:hypothetical protein [Methylosinus sporium]|uniref:Uncharacterized protein n=1 Tax=Methylosinus sporium TaxID=428 RepID=A0A2U1SSR1_METSR|nr:hypothetical protein [Methylosinus sporium]PWB94654.1 hypothetical protein C5689_06215 [Methylosinus sporium]
MSNNSDLPERVTALEKQVAELTERLDNLSARPPVHINVSETFRDLLKESLRHGAIDRAISERFGFRASPARPR